MVLIPMVWLDSQPDHRYKKKNQITLSSVVHCKKSEQIIVLLHREEIFWSFYLSCDVLPRLL